MGSFRPAAALLLLPLLLSQALVVSAAPRDKGAAASQPVTLLAVREQCGGLLWSGGSKVGSPMDAPYPGVSCAQGLRCHRNSKWYYECVPETDTRLAWKLDQALHEKAVEGDDEMDVVDIMAEPAPSAKVAAQTATTQPKTTNTKTQTTTTRPKTTNTKTQTTTTQPKTTNTNTKTATTQPRTTTTQPKTTNTNTQTTTKQTREAIPQRSSDQQPDGGLFGDMMEQMGGGAGDVKADELFDVRDDDLDEEGDKKQGEAEVSDEVGAMMEELRRAVNTRTAEAARKATQQSARVAAAPTRRKLVADNNNGNNNNNQGGQPPIPDTTDTSNAQKLYSEIGITSDQIDQFAQCGGKINAPQGQAKDGVWDNAKCWPGWECSRVNEWFHQCTPIKNYRPGPLFTNADGKQKLVLEPWGQCGGKGGQVPDDESPVDGEYPGKVCFPDTKCTRQNEWYWQCLPLRSFGGGGGGNNGGGGGGGGGSPSPSAPPPPSPPPPPSLVPPVYPSPPGPYPAVYYPPPTPSPSGYAYGSGRPSTYYLSPPAGTPADYPPGTGKPASY